MNCFFYLNKYQYETFTTIINVYIFYRDAQCGSFCLHCITLYVICLSFSEVTVWLVVVVFSNSIGLQYISKILYWNNNNCIILYKNTHTGPAFTASVQRREIREGYYVLMKESFEHCMFFTFICFRFDFLSSCLVLTCLMPFWCYLFIIMSYSIHL